MTSSQETKETQAYAYDGHRDGVDDTWEIYHPGRTFMVSVRFWDGNGDNEAPGADERAKLNRGGFSFATYGQLATTRPSKTRWQHLPVSVSEDDFSDTGFTGINPSC